MLTSITPLGERGRDNRWGVTVGALIVGSLVAGAGLGGLLGALGSALVGGIGVEGRLAILAAALAIGIAVEAGRRLRLPTVRRQVNEDWLGGYRGWVYGLGFGVQLGSGWATIIVSSAVYATLVASFAVVSFAGGAAIGGTFGLLRGASILVAATVRSPAELASLGVAIRRWRRPTRRAALIAQGALALAAGAAAMLG